MTAHDPKKVPDPSAGCPRCHYFENLLKGEPARVLKDEFPLGIDQVKTAELLNRAFPQKQRSYG